MRDDRDDFGFDDDGLAEDASQQEDADDGYVVEDEGVLDSTDTLDDDSGDPLDQGVEAADHWAGADHFGTTAAEERQGESLDERLAEEEPDINT
jgi:hypothetical protein